MQTGCGNFTKLVCENGKIMFKSTQKLSQTGYRKKEDKYIVHLQCNSIFTEFIIRPGSGKDR